MPTSMDAQAYAEGESATDLLSGFVTKAGLAHELGVSERTIDRWVNLRQFRKPAKIGRLILWRSETVREHLRRLAEAEVENQQASAWGRRR